MRLLRTVGLTVLGDGEVQRRAKTRRDTGEVLSAVRCPRCGGELVVRMGRGRPAFWCRCPVKRAVAMGA